MCSQAKLWSLLGALLLFTPTGPPAKGQEGPQTSSAMYDPDLHLFVDNSEIALGWHVDRVLGTPEMSPDPIVVADKPWEIRPDRQISNHAGLGSVIYDPGYKKFRMWYSSIARLSRPDPKDPSFMCYAESDDGIHWVKPALGIVEYKHSMDNNIVFANAGGPFGFMVMRDEREKDPAKRYKGIGIRHPGVITLLTSPDGLHWPAVEGVPRFDDKFSLAWDPIRELYTMVKDQTSPMDMLDHAGRKETTLGLYESPTLDQWQSQGLGISFNEVDRYQGSTHQWIMNPFVYRNQYLGLVDVESLRRLNVTNHQELMSSQDGRSWQEVAAAGQAFIAPPGGNDYLKLINLASGPPIPVGDDVYFYYTSRIDRKGAIGFAKVRRDRFAGLRSGEGQVPAGDANAITKTVEPLWGNFHPSYVLSKPVEVSGPKLQVNLQTQTVGTLRVSVRQPYVDDNHPGGEPIPGFTSAECIPLSGDTTRLEVHWKNHQDLSELVGKEISLMFELKDATIWSYRFGH